MLPHKHYGAFEIEGVLSEGDEEIEDTCGTSYGGDGTSCVSGAEESTIGRWKRDFREILPVLALKLEALVECVLGTRSSMVEVRALKRVYRAVSLLETIPDCVSRLGRAFYLSMAHPLCLG